MLSQGWVSVCQIRGRLYYSAAQKHTLAQRIASSAVVHTVLNVRDVFFEIK